MDRLGGCICWHFMVGWLVGWLLLTGSFLNFSCYDLPKYQTANLINFYVWALQLLLTVCTLCVCLVIVRHTTHTESCIYLGIMAGNYLKYCTILQSFFCEYNLQFYEFPDGFLKQSLFKSKQANIFLPSGYQPINFPPVQGFTLSHLRVFPPVLL